MTVKELIEQLKDLPQDRQVLVEDYGSGWLWSLEVVSMTETHWSHKEGVVYCHFEGEPLDQQQFVILEADITREGLQPHKASDQTITYVSFADLEDEES